MKSETGISKDDLKKKLLLWFGAMRAPFFTASLVPVILGASVAYYETGAFNPAFFIFTTLGVVMLHASGNMANDYFDYRSGADQLNKTPTPFSGGSRVLVDGLLKPGELLTAIILTSAFGLAIGLFLALKLGMVLLFLGLLGLFGAYAYSAPPLKLAYRGLGEVVVALVFGPLIVVGAYYVQTGGLISAPVIASLPLAILIAAVLYINEFPDYEADKKAGKNQLVVKLGLVIAVRGYAILLAAAYILIIVGVVWSVMPPFAFLGLLTVPHGVQANRLLQKYYNDSQSLIPANALTIKIHLKTGLLLSLGYVVSAFY